MVRLRHFAEVNPPSRRFFAATPDQEVVFLPLEAVWPDGRLDTSRMRQKNEVEVGYTRFESGDVLVPKITPTFQAGRVAVVPEIPGHVGAGTTELHIVRARPTADARFLHYVLRSPAFIAGGIASMQGVAGQQRVPDEFVRDFPVCAFALDEQRRIADFLDQELAEMDAVEAQLQRIADLGEERWRSQLGTAVLGVGRDGWTSLMPWVELCPEGWSRQTLRRLVCDIVGGAWGNDPGAAAVDLPCVRAADFDYAHLRAVDGATRSYRASEWASRCLDPGDLVIEKSGGGAESPVGRVIQWEGATTAVPTNFAARMRCAPGMDPRYVLYAFAAAYEMRVNTRSIKQTTGIQNLDLGSYLTEPWPVPPAEVQTSIARQLDEALHDADALRDAVNAQLLALAERRQVLITEAVTGKLDLAGVTV